MAAQDSSFYNGVKNVIAGGVSGVCMVLVGHPFDTLKVKLQAMPNPKPGEAPLYTGMVDCIKKTVAEHGPQGLYKGMTSPLIAITANNALSFFAYGFAKDVLRTSDMRPGDQLDLTRIWIAGGFSGLVMSFVEGPGDLFKTKMQVQGNAAKYTSAVHAAKSIYAEHGIRGATQGLTITMVRNIPANGFYFWGYEKAKRSLTPEGSTPTTAAILTAGGLGGFAYWTPTFPIDVIKSKMQADTYPVGKYKGMLDCVRKVYAEEGAKAFSRGLLPCAIRAFPANAACFLGYETAMRLLP